MWKAIRNACRMQKEITISVPAEDGIAMISTENGGPPWPAPMLVFIHVNRGFVEWKQHFETVEEAKEEFEREGRLYHEWKSDLEKRKRRVGD